MISLGTLALVSLIAVLPAALGFLAGHVNGTNSANKANALKMAPAAPKKRTAKK